MRLAYTLARHELRLLVSLLLWAGRRRHGVGGGRAFGYARGQGAVMAGFVFVCMIETFTMSVLLRDWPTVHAVVLVLDLYTVLFVAGLYAAWQVRPHVLDGDALRVRHAAHVDLRIPLDRIAAVRHETRSTHERADGELNLPVGSQTSVTLELSEPVPHFTFLGRRSEVKVVRLHADDARELVRAVQAAQAVKAT
ncbi:hypothetical protein [Streptomyces aurantiogriseus]|uniref:Uncharacterized protein n=1 Tax=Streptomyces aurantiogriseus TaxID=66870 RepID=A0A918CMV5_9ACTN|nr:hypothetical protein [Streptomyces aurantiogriseus]GGR30956.1 hypothetical protein GCM10010251_53820 [Streptomyces aurantiogriseus]